MDIRKIDPNMQIESKLDLPDARFYDVREEPFEVYGLYNHRNEPQFKRLPDEIGLNVNEGVKELYLNTAGGRVRFSTDSKYIAIKVSVPRIHLMTIMPLSGSSGFDLYLDDPETGESRYCKCIHPDREAKTYFEGVVTFNHRRMRHFTLYFPSYNQVTSLHIGVQQDAVLGGGMKYKDVAPFVYYGSSITQGASSSRPGNTYENILERKFGVDYLNLGFSGNGKAEDTIVDYMCTLPMSLFVSDYDHNASTVDYLRQTHLKMYQKIRAAHPDIPYIMLSRPDYDCWQQIEANIERLNVVYETYRYAIQNGDKNVYFIDGSSIFRGPYEDCCTVDSVHPNDLGFVKMAEAIGSEIRRSFTQQKINY